MELNVIRQADPQVADAIEAELNRQRSHIELIASENFVSPAVMAAMQAYPAVYFAAVGGAAALMAECVTSLEVICWDDLGPESVKRLTLKDLPLVVAADCYGQDAFTLGQKAYLEGKNEA